MAKKQRNASEEEQRQSRKEVLQKRKEQQGKRNIYIGAGLVVGLLVILFLVAIVSEVVVAPSRPVAEVNGEEITLSDWQERVRFERAQRVVFIEEQFESFGDISLIQQFYAQVLNELSPSFAGATVDPVEDFGQIVKNQMIDDVAIIQAAEARGITVTDEEVDAWLEESLGYFGGESPTPFPSPTATFMPTPSLTPIPTAVITEIVPTNTPFPTFTPGPTQPPPPTSTPKSEEAYQDDLGDLLSQYQEYGFSEETYREYIRIQLYRQKLADAIAEEQNLPTSADHASFLFIFFDSEEEANATAAQVESEGFLEVWNEIRSGVTDEESTAVASELLWRDQSSIQQTFGSEVAETVMSMDLNEPSDVIVQAVDAQTNRYFIVYTTGREVRDLTAAAIEQAKQLALNEFVASILANGLTVTDFERGRAPDDPSLDLSFYEQQATPDPQLPVLPDGG